MNNTWRQLDCSYVATYVSCSWLKHMDMSWIFTPIINNYIDHDYRKTVMTNEWVTYFYERCSQSFSMKYSQNRVRGSLVRVTLKGWFVGPKSGKSSTLPFADYIESWCLQHLCYSVVYVTMTYHSGLISFLHLLFVFELGNMVTFSSFLLRMTHASVRINDRYQKLMNQIKLLVFSCTLKTLVGISLDEITYASLRRRFRQCLFSINTYIKDDETMSKYPYTVMSTHKSSESRTFRQSWRNKQNALPTVFCIFICPPDIRNTSFLQINWRFLNRVTRHKELNCDNGMPHYLVWEKHVQM